MKIKPIGSNQTVMETETGEILFSYSTPVAARLAGRGLIKTRKFHSTTTSKHINSWIKSHTGIDTCEALIELVKQEELDNLAGGV